MASDCYSCILERAKFESDLVFSAERDKKGTMEELLDFMACHKGGIPALIGTERELIIKRRSKKSDPYRNLKAESNLLAFSLLPMAMRFYEESENKTEALIRIAAAANSMEFGVRGHNFDVSTFGRAFGITLQEKLEANLSEVERRINSFNNIFYLTDNSGEIVFDLFVIEKFKEMGRIVVIGSKSKPVLNDVTAKEVRKMTEDKVIATGSVVGTSLEYISSRASKLLFSKNWLIFSKGMGNFETISEFDNRLKGRLIYVLRAKCEPVAFEMGVPRGTLVVKII